MARKNRNAKSRGFRGYDYNRKRNEKLAKNKSRRVYYSRGRAS